MSSQQSTISNKAATSAAGKSSLGGVTQQGLATPQAHLFASDGSARRSGSGSASSARPTPTARNSQASKPKHKQSKRYRALDEDAEAETYSMQNPHGRRGQQSITHLMQFALPPRPGAGPSSHRHAYHAPRRGGRPGTTWGLGSGHHAIDKARYVHANYRFIVDPRSNYRAQAEDADVHLEWTDVMQVIASSKTQTASCPICLGEPTAPRMAKCGHIFCLSCLIRYMHAEDAEIPPEKRARWKKCPICWDSIYISETRPVRWYIGQESDPPHEGDDIVLRLVKRKPHSTLAMPRENASTIAKGDDIPWYFAAEVMDYARIMKGSEGYMIQQYDEAIIAIEQQEREDELMFGEDTEWTGRAIRMLKDAKEKVKGVGNAPAQPKKPVPVDAEPQPVRPLLESNRDNQDVPDMYIQKQSSTPSPAEIQEIAERQAHERDEDHPDETQVPRTLTEMRQRNTEKPQPSEYLFYQALLHYYLSPLDIRILKAAFGSYSAFPSSILPRVERVSSGHVVDDDLRKRVKYLSHLPYGCEVAFLECDWTDLVGASVLEEFRPMLERRRRRNDEKDAREEKERIRIEKAEERELASIRHRRRPSIPESDPFFASLTGTSPALPSAHPSSLIGSQNEAYLGTSQSPPWSAQTHRPGFGSLASPSTSPSLPRTVWGTAVVGPASPELHATLPRDDQMHDDGWLQGWEKDLLDAQQDDLVANMEGLSVQAKPTGGKKGKKGKKITLMSTATARRGA